MNTVDLETLADQFREEAPFVGNIGMMAENRRQDVSLESAGFDLVVVHDGGVRTG
jgi:hypothetical protein